ncbi:MAG TPA: BrnT family toxin [Pyrinomonadaceae bacterium]|jgi:hypothetical protein
MRFEWDEEKRRINLTRHGFDFVDAEQVFENETATILDDRFDYGEIRFVSFGLLKGFVVAVVPNQVKEITRIISFRKATKNEERYYFEKIRN